MKTKLSTRIWAMLLCVLMCVSLLPASAFAENTAAEDSVDFAAEEVVEAQPAGEADCAEPVEDAAAEEPANPAAGQENTAPADEPAQPAEESAEPAGDDEASFETFEETEELKAPEETASNDAALASSGTCGDNLTWKLDSNGTLTISGTGAMDDYYTWENNYEYASWYSSKASIKSVVIESGVTTIGEYAFSDCTALTSVSIPASVKNIRMEAFDDCDALEKITIDDIASWLSISYRDRNYDYAGSFGTNPLNASYKNKTLYIGNAEAKNITIPASVSSIPQYAFYKCTNIATVTISSGVTSIGEEAFSGCTALTSVSIPASVKSIYAYAFLDCDALTKITIEDVSNWLSISYPDNKENNYCRYSNPLTTNYKDKTLYIGNAEAKNIVIPDGVTNIPQYAFYKCTNIATVTIPDSVTSIGSSAFNGCSGLTSIAIPDNVTSIGQYAFSGCTALTSVSIPASVKSIYGYAFDDCDALTKITIEDVSNWLSISYPDNKENNYCRYSNPLTTNYKDKTLYIGNAEAKNIVIPDGVTNIPQYAFYKCTNIATVTIPESVTSIGRAAFSGCSMLYKINLPANLTDISDNLFYGCERLKAITLPDKITTIGEDAFYNCSALASITIPDSVTTIGTYAFAGCSSLGTIVIGKGLTTIGSDAFSKNCSSNVYIGTLEQWMSFSFSDTSSNPLYGSSGSNLYINGVLLENLVIPSGTTAIGNYAFYDASITSLTIPEGVTTIGKRAFYYCTSLTDVQLPETITSIDEAAFYECYKLTVPSVLPSSLTSVGENAFRYCKLPEEITMPAGIDLIDARAFDSDSTAYISNVSVTVSALKCIHFLGDAPSYVGTEFAGSADNGVYITYESGAAGFTTPKWEGHDCYERNSVPAKYTVGLTLSVPSASMAANESQKITVKDYNGNTVAASDILWTVTEDGTGNINSDGTLYIYSNPSGSAVTVKAMLKSEPAVSGTLTVSISVKPTGISLSATSMKISLTDSVSLTATVLPSAASQNVKWYSSNESVIRVDENGNLYPLAVGSAVIVAVCASNGNIQATCNVNVVASSGASVKEVRIVTPDNATTFTAGNKVQLSAALTPAGATDTVTWSILGDVSSKQVSINAKGVLTIAKTCPAMTINVQAGVNGIADTVELQIIPQVTKLNLTEAATIYVYEATSVQLGITVEPETASAAVTWKSSNEKIATVDETGLVTVNGTLGSVNITATSTDGSKKTVKYTIKVVRPVEDITLTTPNEYAVAGNSLQLKAVVTPSNAGLKTVEWSLDADESLASYLTLSTGGKLTVLKTLPTDISGTVTVTAKAIGASEPISQSVMLKVVAKATGVTLYKDGVELIKNAKETVWLDQNDSFKLTAAAAPAAACQEFIWSSSNKKVAEVDQEGNVNACAKGSTTITATTTDGKKVAAKYTLTVGIPVESVEITNASAMPYLVPGGSFTPKTSFSPTKPTSKTIVWSLDAGDAAEFISFNAKNGKISVNKNYTASEPVTLTLTACATGAADDVIETATFTLMGAKAKTVKLFDGETDVTGKKLTLEGDAMSLTAVVNPDAALQDVTWKSSNEQVLSVDADGNVTAQGKKGSATITATALDGSKVSGKVTITVK